MRKLAHLSVEGFGRIDVWGNNTGVTVYGRFEELPVEVYRRVIETNLFGRYTVPARRCPIFGSKAASSSICPRYGVGSPQGLSMDGKGQFEDAAKPGAMGPQMDELAAPVEPRLYSTPRQPMQPSIS